MGSMKQAILDFSKQFSFVPEVENKGKLAIAKKFVVCGMGGSHLPAELLSGWIPDLPLVIHKNYGLPEIFEAEKTLFVFSSYSGNTEEILDGYQEAKNKGYNLAVVAAGGKLIELAKLDQTPYVLLPNTGIQPRSALGFSLLGLCALSRLPQEKIDECKKAGESLDVSSLEEQGIELAKKLRGRVPIIYSSEKNSCLALNWKIKMNETGKIPAFMNLFPELNHNEMTGFNVGSGAMDLNRQWSFIFLEDEADHPRIKKRMEVTAGLLEKLNLPVERILLTKDVFLSKIFKSLILADWTALNLAEAYGAEPEQVPMVEDLKKSLI